MSIVKRNLLPILLLGLLAASCSTTLVPEPSRSHDRNIARYETTPALAAMERDWNIIWNPKATEEQKRQAEKHYNYYLLELLRQARYRMDEEGKLPHEMEGAVYADGIDFAKVLPYYDDIVPAADIPEDELAEHYKVEGLGVPLVGVITAENVGIADNNFTMHSRGTVSTLTAVMTFPKGKKPRVELVLRQRHETYRHGRQERRLAADFSASIEVYWNLTQLKKDRLLGLLRPQKLRDTTGLCSMEGYNPDKIPVILTHGLASSADTFNNLVNRLTNDPYIRSRYQFWYFNYPTGMAWTQTSAMYRQALADARAKLDPQHRNKNWDRMVVIGHSMGGLITHYSQCTEPWLLLRHVKLKGAHHHSLLSAEYVDTPFPAEKQAIESLRKDYFFRPVQAGMVVYMATPHRGAPVAQYSIVNLLTSLVQLPQDLLGEAYNLATLQEDSLLLNPRMLTRWFTSVNQLSPSSYSIRGLQGLSVRNVATHSYIGNRGSRRPLTTTSDGVVPYWSSHITWGTETIIPTDHHVQDSKETAEALIQRLKEYGNK